jgi:hypothetical protein
MNRKKNLRLTGRLALALLVFGISSGDSEAQVEVTPDQTYLLLATESTGTMEEELGEAAALGFRVVTAAPTSGNELVLFLERVTEPPDTYDYRLLATTRTSTLQEELEAAAAEGFRFLSRTPICKSRRFGGDEIVAILERAPGDAQQYEYQLLATSRTATLQNELSDAVATGFAMSAIVSCGEHIALMERQAP